MILDQVNRSIVAVLSAVKTTNDGAVVSTIIDSVSQRTTPVTFLRKSSGTVEVELIPAPAPNTARLVKEITYENTDTIDQTITISVKEVAVYFQMIVMLVPHGRTLQFQDGYGWSLVT